MRPRSAIHLGWETVPAILVDIPEQLANERAMRDNAQWGESMVSGTPLDLAALTAVSKPVVRARYRFEEVGEPALAGLVQAVIA